MKPEPDDMAIQAATPEGGAALQLLLTRYSVSGRHLGAPGPSDDQLWAMALAAMRAPDHDKLMPFRFVVLRGRGLERLADLFEDYGRRKGKKGAQLVAERTRALQAPVAVAVVARIDPDHPDVPPHEQWTCVGGAISNALTALHFMGFAGKMVAGARAADPAIVSAFCGAGETFVGWITAGTPTALPTPRGERDPGFILSSFPDSPA
ncbi:MAG: nitroreductase family protein [Betaproteobacteria bacterium]|nr:nitroreductase family protein [Betaproteobacteria bacterium]